MGVGRGEVVAAVGLGRLGCDVIGLVWLGLRWRGLVGYMRSTHGYVHRILDGTSDTHSPVMLC